MIEDNPNDAELAMYALQKNRLANHIVVLRDGAEALDYLFDEAARERDAAADAPKLILLDLKLPKVDGIDVLRRLKSDPRTKSIPVVMLTSSREERDIVKSYQLGVNSYIVKPVDFDQFTKAVQEIGLYWLLLNEQPHPRGGG
ncbi:MAG: response regulator [Spirochaetales bacterium]|nr:response regulator [Spirochaetales bacterium]